MLNLSTLTLSISHHISLPHRQSPFPSPSLISSPFQFFSLLLHLAGLPSHWSRALKCSSPKYSTLSLTPTMTLFRPSLSLSMLSPFLCRGCGGSVFGWFGVAGFVSVLWLIWGCWVFSWFGDASFLVLLLVGSFTLVGWWWWCHECLKIVKNRKKKKKFVYCSKYIILLYCLYYFILLKAKTKPLMLDGL